MKVVNNMQLLGGSSQNKKAITGFSLKFDGQKVSQVALRQQLKIRVGSCIYPMMVNEHSFDVRQNKQQEKTELERKKLGNYFDFIP